MDEIVDTAAIPLLVYPQTGTPWWETGLDFIASLAGSLAWPIVVLIVLLAFKEQLINALKNIRSFKFGDAEAVFGTELKEANEKAKAIETPTEQTAQTNAGRTAQLVDMAVVSPTGAIVEAWKDVLDAMTEVLQRATIVIPDRPAPANALNLINHFKKYGLLPKAELDVLNDLRTLRNRAAHISDDTITTAQAQNYVRLADRVIDVMNSITVVPAPATDPLNER